MAIKFACPTCQHAFKTDEKFAGRQATCPSCRSSLTIPALPEPELVPAEDRRVAHTPKLSQPAPRPFVAEELSEDFNPFASPQAEDTRPSFAGIYHQRDLEQEAPYGSFLSRWAAMFLDGIIVNVTRVIGIVVINIAAVGLLGRAGANAEGPAEIIFGIFAIAVWFGVPWLYDGYLESSSNQATLGKMALGLKVTNLQGQPISFGQATGRHFGKYLSQAVFCLGYLMQPFTEKKQALHDKLAGCLVIKYR